MPNDIDNLDADLETMRALATRHNGDGSLTALIHACTSAILGDRISLEILEGALDAIEEMQSGDRTIDSFIKYLHLVDCTRPDGAIARTTITP
jgi:hypothetical protein